MVPDVFVERRGGELLVSVNSSLVPRLFISPSYQQILKEDPSKDTKEYVAQKLRQAEWAVQCVGRRESTLLETAKQIVAVQREFFLSPNGALKPLRMVECIGIAGDYTALLLGVVFLVEVMFLFSSVLLLGVL